MNALILTCRFGMGHYSVADTIDIELKKKGYTTLTVDLMDYIYPFASKSIYFVFEYLVKYQPNLYNMTGTHSDGNKPPFKKYGIMKMKKLINEFDADIIVSTFPVCSSYAGALKEHYNKDVKLYTYITDFFPGKEWVVDNTDVYFVASFDTKKDLINYGVDRDKIVVSGIPVKKEFVCKNSKKNNKNIVIMGGGLGIIPEIYMMIDKLKSISGVNITVITGTNKNLYDNLTKKYDDINIVGFTTKMYEYLNNSNLVITKPGGITVFEAIRTNTPLCIIKPFLLQEMTNAKFIVEHNMGIEVDVKDDDFKEKIEKLFNEGTINEIKQSMEEFTSKLENIVPDEYY